LKVMKFGGSCIDTPDDVRRMVEIIKSEQKQQPKAVLSAVKGVTDQLVAQADSARSGKFDVEPIERKHRQLLDDLPASIRTPLEAKITELLADLRNTLTAVSYLKEFTPSTMDKIVTFGERLAVHIASGYMTEAGLKSQPLFGIEAGILTDSNFGNAAIMDKSSDLVREKVGSTHIPLIAGYFGHDEAGRIATLGRGASDYIATYVASALGCRCVLYKDVDGIMTADPKIVKNAKLVTNIDYLTAIELARYGSKVLFEKAVRPAMKKGLPIRVTSFLHPGDGTLIAGEGSAQVISSMKNIAMIDLREMHGLNAIASMLQQFGSTSAEDPVIVTRASRNDISFVTGERCADMVTESAKRLGRDVKVEIKKGLGLVAIVGSRLEIPQAYQLLQREEIASHALVKSGSERSILIVVDLNDAERATRVLHDKLLP